MNAGSTSSTQIQSMHSAPTGLRRWGGLALGLGLAGLVGCSHTPQQGTHPSSAAEPPRLPSQSTIQVSQRTQDVLPTQGLDSQQLFLLLSAEIAGQRNQLDYALNAYSELAFTSEHPALVERATWIAQFARQTQAALDLSLLWARIAPEDDQARSTAAGLLLQQDLYLEAYEHLKALKQLSGESNFALLASHLIDSGNPVASDLYQKMLRDAEDDTLVDSDWHLALALLSEDLGETQASQAHLDAALALTPHQVRAVQLQAQRWSHENKLDQAISLLEAALTEHPDETRLLMTLARLQLTHDRLDDASHTFDRILALQPGNPHLRLGLARIQIETQQYELAEQQLRALLAAEQLMDESWFYLGRLKQAQGNDPAAIEAYRRVAHGSHLSEAGRALAQLHQQQGTPTAALEWLDLRRRETPESLVSLTLIGEQLLREQESPEAALLWVNSARQLHPLGAESSRLLYARALLFYRLQQPEQTEADLRDLLAREPNNPMLLNALGYTLVDQTTRITEGFLYIQRAYALDSESPEILDSMGWALYRLGRYTEALEYLEEAFARLADEEILSHLAQTLKRLDRLEEAHQRLDEWIQYQGQGELLDTLFDTYPELDPHAAP